MESVVDINWIERNMKCVVVYLGILEEKLYIDIWWMMLMVNVSDEKYFFFKFQKCEKYGINMEVILKISKFLWCVIEQDYLLDKYEEELEKIVCQECNYIFYVVVICIGFVCGGFCKLFGGDWIVFLIMVICIFVGFCICVCCIEFGINVYMSIVIFVFLCICLVYVFFFLGLFFILYYLLLVCILYIVFGVLLINFVDDMIDNYLLVGIMCVVNMVMMVGGMVFGIVFVLRLLVMSDVIIDQKFSELSMVLYDVYWVYVVVVVIVVMGFVIIFNVQRCLLWVVVVGGIIVVCICNFVNFELGYGLVIGLFMGSFVVSLIVVKVVYWFYVFNYVLIIFFVILMVFGVLMYCLLLVFINMCGVVGEVMFVFFNGINLVFIIFCIVLGVVVFNIFVWCYIVKDCQCFFIQMLVECRVCGKFIEWQLVYVSSIY